MHLTRFTDYSLRALIHCAQNQGRRCSIDEICTAFVINRSHATKVVHHLAKCGYLESTRGQNGGIELARDPSAINIADVIRDCEPNMDLLDCFSEQGSDCPIDGHCKLKAALRQAHTAFMSSLMDYSLADVLSKSTARS